MTIQTNDIKFNNSIWRDNEYNIYLKKTINYLDLLFKNSKFKTNDNNYEFLFDKSICEQFNNLDKYDFENTVGPEYAIQQSLLSLVCNINKNIYQRLVAYILCIWIGQIDTNIETIFYISIGACKFMLNCLISDPPLTVSSTRRRLIYNNLSSKKMSSTFIQNLYEAERILTYYCKEESNSTTLRN